MFSFFCGFPNLIQRINSVWVQVIFINYSFTSYNLLFSDLNILNLIISKGKGSLWFVVVEFTGALKQLPCHLFWSFLPWIVLTPICTFFLTFRHLRIYWQLAHWGCFCKDSFMGCINLSFLCSVVLRLGNGLFCFSSSSVHYFAISTFPILKTHFIDFSLLPF